MIKKALCAVDDTEHSKSAVVLAAELATATGAELTLLAVNEPLGGAGRMEGIYVWENADVGRVLDSATAVANKAGVSDPKTMSVKTPLCGAGHRRICRGQRR